LQVATSTSAFHALVLARSGRLHSPDVASLTRDDNTKPRVQAFYWQQQAEHAEASLRQSKVYDAMYRESGNAKAVEDNRRSKEQLQDAAASARAKADGVLGELEPLDEAAWEGLVRRIVRELHATATA